MNITITKHQILQRAIFTSLLWGASASNVTNASQDKTWSRFQDLRVKYRTGEINDKEMWGLLVELNEVLPKLPGEQQATILQTQANVLSRNGYPILAAINAAQAIKKASDPFSNDYSRSWTIIKEVSREKPIQNLLESIAESLIHHKKNPGTFGSDWKYIEGNVLYAQGQSSTAMDYYAQVKVNDRYFFPSKYQQAMIQLDAGKRDEAIASLKSIVYPTSQELSSLNRDELRLLTDDANIALGRIFYEQKKFNDAMTHYRLISRDSHNFYESLFEQGWSLFMAGYPNHALGVLHSVRGPFFPDSFNPEATMLSAIIYYWMCRYNDSRNELADFLEKNRVAMKQLQDYISRKNLDADVAYSLFENTVTGVSSEGLGMPRNLLNSAAEKDSMMHVRDQYAAVLEELQKLQIKGVFGSKEHVETLRSYLEQWSVALRKDIGKRFIVELQEMHQDFTRLHDQAQFLYIELLMSQKDQLLGKELHSDSKIGKVVSSENISGWGKYTQAYASDDKLEYWQDEVGFHIFRLVPLCK
ncbi:MAG: hypothetical protein NT027_03245 [Proteobacteria bacterium]|nr:hypothetical protein [Pseudomonadota bacterium]